MARCSADDVTREGKRLLIDIEERQKFFANRASLGNSVEVIPSASVTMGLLR